MESEFYSNLGLQTALELKKHYGNPLSQLGAQRCDSLPPLCPIETQWQAKFKDIPSFYIPDYKPMYVRDERAWQTDLNSLQYERSIETGMLWDSYRFMDGRQLHTQYCNSDYVAAKDRYMRPVHSIETSKLVQPQSENARW